LLVGGLLWVRPLAGQESIGERIAESQRRLDSIRRERSTVQREMDALESQVHTVSEEIDNLERQIGSSASVLAELDVQRQEVAAQMDQTTQEMLHTRDELTAHRVELRERLRAVYKRGPLQTMQVLLEAHSFGSLLSRYKYLHLVTRYDRMLVSEVRQLDDLLALQRSRLKQDFSRLQALRTEKTSELGELEQLERKRRQRLKRVHRRESKAQSRLAALVRDETQLRGLMVELERARREAERLSGTPTASTLRTSDLGKLNWPVEGTVVYNFGPERHRGSTVLHRGIGIGAPRGTPVRAVEAGRVEWAGSRELYGQTVILSHGGGYWSIYLYLANLRVATGDRVAAGQALGGVGGDPDSPEGSHVELQILEPSPNGEPREVDPVRWLRSRS